MAALAMTPKLLGCISSEKYQEKDKWKIDDIALGPANELLISGHNLKKPEAFISMYKEDSGKYKNRPEFNRNFRKPQPGEQLALFLKSSSTIGLKVECALRLFTTEGMGVWRTLWLKQSHTCVCFYRGKLYAASSSSTIVSVCNLDSEEKSDIFLSDMGSDCVLDIVVVMEKIYVCTMVAGRALVFSMTGSKKLEFKNAFQSYAMAKSICIHERTELVFVSWSNFQIQLYSQKTSRCLRALDMTEKLHKIRVTTENILVTLSKSKCIVAVYDVDEAIKFGQSQNTIPLSVKKKHQKKLISFDREDFEDYPTDFETLSMPRKSAPMQSNVEKLRDTKELYMKQLEEIEKFRRSYEGDFQKLNKRVEELYGKRTKSQSRKKNVEYSLIKEKEKIPCKERPQFKISDRIRSKEGITRSIEADQGTIHESGLVAAREEIEQAKVQERVRTIEETANSKVNVQETIQEDVAPAVSEVIAQTKLKESKKIPKGMRKETKSQHKKDYLDQEKRKTICEERARVQVPRHKVVTQLKKVEERNTKLEDEVTELNAREKTAKKVQSSSLKISVVRNLMKVKERNTNLGNKMTQLRERLLAEVRRTKEVEPSSLKGRITKDTVAISTENMKTCLRSLIDGILEDTMKLTKQKNNVTEELEITKSTLTKKEEDCSQIQVELEAAISNKMDLEKTVTKSEELYRIIQAKEREIQQLRMLLKKAQAEVENAKTQVSILQDRRQELEKSLSREQERSEELEKLLLNVVKNLKKVEDRNTNLEYEVTQLKERLLAEEKSAKILQASSSKLNERIKELEFTRKKLESQVKKLKDNLVQGKRKVTREERSRVQILETQEDEKRIPRDENIQTVMRSMKGNINLLGEGLSKSKAVLNELDKSTVEQEADKMQLTLALSNVSDDTLLQNDQESVLLKKEASFKSLEISRGELSEECERLPKEVTLALCLSDSFKFGESQRHDRYPYWFNDAEPAVSELMDSGDVTSNLETDECCSGLFAGNVDQVNPELKVAVTVSIKGTKMLIPDTGVELYVPGGSLLSRQLIEINIIDFDNDKFDTLFSLDRNSSVAVQLLPNKAHLRCPARLRLPHCLRLKANFQEVKFHVKIYRSEHALGQEAQWEHDPELRYELKEDCCIIFVKKLCSIRYDVTEEAIDATNVTVFTAGKQHGTSMELAVGYHLDLPGRREMLLTMKSDMKIFNAKPFEFVKDSTDTLQVHLTTAVSRAHNDKETTEVVGKLSVSEAAARIAELPLNRPKPLYSSDTPGLEWNLHFATAILKVSETVSNKGSTMRILDTGIELTIPPYAVKGYQYIEMSVIPFGTLDAPISTFSSNSSVTVELLPNGATFSTPVRLSLPHCLKLKKGFSKRSVKVYLSHHEKDQKPFWEELPDAKYELKEDHCVIYLTSFCWVKYEIDNKIVVAKRIRVYTATRGMEQNDQIAEVEVGYFIDMPGRAENLKANVDLKISQCKPLLFFKEGNLPLQIYHIKVLPMFWKYSTPDRNPKAIPYKSIADSLDTSLPFVFEKQDAREQKPFAMFKVSQGNEEVEINIRF